MEHIRQRRVAFGYSLLEVMVAFVILLLAILFILSIFPTSLFGVAMAEDLEQAASISNNLLSTMEMYQSDFARIADATGSVTSTGYRNGVSYSKDYSYVITVTAVSPRLKDVLITVSWPSNRRTQSLQAEGLFADLDPN